MLSWIVEPEVAGELGPESEIDFGAGGAIRVHRLHFVLQGWLGDDLVTTHPCFLVTRRLAAALEQAALTGISVATAHVTPSDELTANLPELIGLSFWWLKVHGAQTDDFRLTDDGCLLVSDAGLEVLRQFSLSHAIVTSAP